MKSGVLCLYKEKGFTSHDAVARIRKLFGTKKVGHTGTLDPQATGVLPVLIGNAVKACDLLPDDTKIYRATVRFGIETDTEDIWGTVLREDSNRPDREVLEQAVSSFTGEYMQTPPMVSAVKIGGKKLYEYAREGKVIDRPARRVFVHRFELCSYSGHEAGFVAEVSKGTYIRTLLTDLCARVGCIGTMIELERIKSSSFVLENSVTLEQLEQMTLSEREGLLLQTERIFTAHPVYCLSGFFGKLVSDGQAVNCEKLELSDEPLGKRFRLYANGTFFALGEIIEKNGEKCLFKIKNFPADPQ